MFQKGQRVITPFGTGTIASVQQTACVVELTGDNRKRIGTFVHSKLQVCSLAEAPVVIPLAPEIENRKNDDIDALSPEVEPERKSDDADVLSLQPEAPVTPKRKRGSTKRSA